MHQKDCLCKIIASQTCVAGDASTLSNDCVDGCYDVSNDRSVIIIGVVPSKAD
jgi:hypothetical protein